MTQGVKGDPLIDPGGERRRLAGPAELAGGQVTGRKGVILLFGPFR